MAIREIVYMGDPVLRTEAEDVTVFDDDLRALVRDMFETMYRADGIGLAAPQIGISKRIFVADIGDGPFVMVNPEIVEICSLETAEQEAVLQPLLEAHQAATGSEKAAAILSDWPRWRSRFKVLVPPSERAAMGLVDRAAVTA